MIQDEHRKRAIFTLKQIVREGLPILYVVHDKDDEWQFLSNGNVSVDDLMIISLDEVLNIDPSLENILWIPEGTEARRERIGGDWVTAVYSD